MNKIAIIGGGAAGLAAACMLSQRGLLPVVFEKQNRVGRKLLSTGNGRCNLSNTNLTPQCYGSAAEFVAPSLKRFGVKQALTFFETLGVKCITDNAGRVYPASGQAAGVLDALRLYASEKGVRFETESCVSEIKRRKDGFELCFADGKSVRTECVLICCGGMAAPKLGGCSDGVRLLEKLGHPIVPSVPALAPLKADAALLRPLKGIRARAKLSLYREGRCLRSEQGEVLFGDGNVSGICAMQLAELANRHKSCKLVLNFCPDSDKNPMDALCAALPQRSLEDLLSGIVPKRLGQTLIKAAGVSPLSLCAYELTPQQKQAIWRTLSGWTLDCPGSQGFDAAQLSAGGADLKFFSAETLQSKKCPGLYAAGEVLNVCGDCGGFNLHWAWASAYSAAASIAAIAY